MVTSGSNRTCLVSPDFARGQPSPGVPSLTDHCSWPASSPARWDVQTDGQTRRTRPERRRWCGIRSKTRRPENRSPSGSGITARSQRRWSGQVAGVQAGDVVWLLGRDEDLPLLEDLAVEVQKRGGSPLVTVRTERLRRRLYDEVPAQYDTIPPEANLRLASVVDVIIGTESSEQRTLEGVPPERIEARSRADGPVLALMRKRGVRSVWLGTGLYPSAERAEQLGISRRDLAEMLYGGINVDYRAAPADRRGAPAGGRRRGTNCTSRRRMVRTCGCAWPAARCT